MKKSNIFSRFSESLAKFYITLPSFCICALSAFLCALFGFELIYADKGLKITSLKYASGVSAFWFFAAIAALTVTFLILNFIFKKKLTPAILLASFMAYALTSTAMSSNASSPRAYTAIVFSLLTVLVFVFAYNYIKRECLVYDALGKKDISARLSFIIVSAAFVLFSAFFIILLGARTYTYCSPCFDMGIFTQMYDNMTECFLPITTVERAGELSHFAVHFSPILYLLLPFCYIFKPTDVLVVAQIAVVFSSVFPIWLICRKLKFSNLNSALIPLLFLLYPAMSSGAFYDFHENAFLAPLILWTLYFLQIEKYAPAFVFALGVLAVKEDAVIYIAFIALYLIFSKGKKKKAVGFFMLAMGVAYFGMAIYILSLGGQGNMLGSRYFNLIGYEGSVGNLLKLLVLNPALYAIESFTAEKLLYFVTMLLPLAFMPFITKHPSRWLLIAPLFVMNLVSDYKYQYDIGFQYSFGSGALLFFLALLNLSDIMNKTSDGSEGSEAVGYFFKKSASCLLLFALCASALFMAARLPSQSSYVQRYFDERESLEVLEDTLSRIDRTKSVTATSFLSTHLYDVDDLYHINDIVHNDGTIDMETDLVVLDLRPYIGDSNNATSWRVKYIARGYEVVEEHENIILILEKK